MKIHGMRLGLALLLTAYLGGCDGATAFLPGASAAEVQEDTKVVSVAGQDVVLGRAAGYCFQDRQSRFTSSGAFVVMASCDPEDETGAAKGLVLVNVLAEEGITDAIKAHDLEGYFQSDAGRAALSRKGNPAQLEVLGTMEENDVYYVHTRDADGPMIPDTTNEQWRVFFVAADRLVSVSVINFVDNQMPDGLVFSQMEEIALRIKGLN